MYRNIWRTSNEPQWSSIERFCAFNKLKITNSFYRHKDVHKFTWEARRTKSIIDYIIINDGLKSNIEDTRVFRGSEIDSDHKLVESKFKIFTHSKYSHNKMDKKPALKVHLLEQELYIETDRKENSNR